jgi:hypothetical protein
MSTLEELQRHESDPTLLVYNSDGSFSVGGKTYLQEVLCHGRIDLKIDFQFALDTLMKRSDFDINKFSITISENNVDSATVRTKQFGETSLITRNVSRSALSSHGGKHYVKCKLFNYVASTGRVFCNILHSFHSSPGKLTHNMPDQILLETTLDEFFCVGHAQPITKEAVQAACDVMNKAHYSGNCSWFYDEEVGAVRMFDFLGGKRSTSPMRPSEAIQIASQLNERGGWANMSRRPQIDPDKAVDRVLIEKKRLELEDKRSD